MNDDGDVQRTVVEADVEITEGRGMGKDWCGLDRDEGGDEDGGDPWHYWAVNSTPQAPPSGAAARDAAASFFHSCDAVACAILGVRWRRCRSIPFFEPSADCSSCCWWRS